jgi:hypothetical protein
VFGFYYPIKDALLFSMLIAAGGVVFMVFGFILSLFITKESVIIPVGVAVMSALFFMTKTPLLGRLNIFNFMVGAGYLSNDDFLFNQPVNLFGIGLIAFMVFVMIMSLSRIFKQMDI